MLAVCLKKPREVINKVAMFLGLECTDEIMELTLEKSSFNKMKCNDKANMSWRKSLFSQDAAPFMRKGVVSYRCTIFFHYHLPPKKESGDC